MVFFLFNYRKVSCFEWRLKYICTSNPNLNSCLYHIHLVANLSVCQLLSPVLILSSVLKFLWPCILTLLFMNINEFKAAATTDLQKTLGKNAESNLSILAHFANIA